MLHAPDDRSSDSFANLAPHASELLDGIREWDAWSAAALAEVIEHHPDLLDALKEPIQNLLHAPEVFAWLHPRITREAIQRQKGDITEAKLGEVNALIDAQRPARARGHARGLLRRAVRRELAARRLSVPPRPGGAENEVPLDPYGGGAETYSILDWLGVQGPGLPGGGPGDEQAGLAESAPPARAGRSAREEATYPITVMLTEQQITETDVALARFNANAIRSRKGKVKRNHVIQAFLDAMVEAGYHLAQHDNLKSFREDLVARLGGSTDWEADS